MMYIAHCCANMSLIVISHRALNEAETPGKPKLLIAFGCNLV